MNMRRFVVSLAVAFLVVFISFWAPKAKAEDSREIVRGQAALTVSSPDEEWRRVAVLIEWFSDFPQVKPGRVRNVQIARDRPFRFVGVVGQTYRVAVTEPSTGFVTNRRVLLRNGGVEIPLPALKRPTPDDRISDLYRQLDEAKAAIKDRDAALAEAEATIRVRDYELGVATGERDSLAMQLASLSSSYDSLARFLQVKKEENAALVAANGKLAQENLSLGTKLGNLQAEVALLRQGTASGFGLRGGVSYVDSWEPRYRGPWDTPVYMDLHNDSIYQTRVSEAQILFRGRPMDRAIPFTVSLIEETDQYAFWGASTMVTTTWRGDLGGWLAVIPTYRMIDGKGHSRPRIRFDSRAFDVQPGLDNEVSISILSTYSYDGISVMTGGDHGSGTIVVPYLP